ncbi:hypothetical protein K4K53_008796 [Colletotrichum sp. SAR 10_77]|nr:hypothetical protein K4K53_008796 [Colletotrichum sp. SAR 10_77]
MATGAEATRVPKTWFITGCSSGFGEILVRKLCAEGENVIATGRQADVKLAHLKDTGAKVMDLDVSASEIVIRETVEQAWAAFPGGVDVVVNNAGYVLSGLVEELTSQAAWHVDISAGAYCASKFALSAAVETLAQELAILAPGLKVLMVEPGYFRTRVFVKLAHIPLRIPEFAGFNAACVEQGAKIYGTEPGDPEKAVERMVELVRGEGMAAGREMPLRVPLGTDGWGRIKKKCEDMIKVCEDWEDVAKSTDW